MPTKKHDIAQQVHIWEIFGSDDPETSCPEIFIFFSVPPLKRQDNTLKWIMTASCHRKLNYLYSNHFYVRLTKDQAYS
jgi:hypothetical protein